jgi:phage terminase small subunit
MAQGRRPDALGITPIEEKFALAYVECGVAADAYMQTAERKCTRTNATVRACELMKRPAVKARIEEIRRTREQQLHDKFLITKERILQELARIGFADIRKAVKWNGEVIPSEALDDDTAACIAEITQTQHGMKVKLHDKMRALDAMCKHLGMFTEKVEVTGKDGNPLVPENASSREMARAILDIFREAQGEKEAT